MLLALSNASTFVFQIKRLQLTLGCCCAGGAQDLRPGNLYYDTMSHIMDWAMEDYDRTGEVFPIHFTCLGLEAVAVKVARNPYILSAPPPPPPPPTCSARSASDASLQRPLALPPFRPR